MNWITAALNNSPPWQRRGGCALNKMPPSILINAQTGWFVQLTSRSARMLNEPPRPLRQRWLRTILLMSRPPLLYQGGELFNSAVIQFIHTFGDRAHS